MKWNCNQCGGSGWTVDQDHGPNCDEDQCREPCPIPIQVQCAECSGMGYFEKSFGC